MASVALDRTAVGHIEQTDLLAADIAEESSQFPEVPYVDRLLDTLPSIARLNDSTRQDFRSVVESMGVCRSGVMDDSR